MAGRSEPRAAAGDPDYPSPDYIRVHHLVRAVPSRRRIGPCAHPTLTATAWSPRQLLPPPTMGRLVTMSPTRARIVGYSLCLSRRVSYGLLNCRCRDRDDTRWAYTHVLNLGGRGVRSPLDSGHH